MAAFSFVLLMEDNFLKTSFRLANEVLSIQFTLSWLSLSRWDMSPALWVLICFDICEIGYPPAMFS